jgi:hypothetical protein
MIRAVTFVAAEHRAIFDGDELSLPDPETNENLTIGTWLDQIRDAPNSAGAARAFLVALCARLQNHGGEFERAFGKETLFACALRTGTPPGNDGGPCDRWRHGSPRATRFPRRCRKDP